ncbi:MAG: UDP-N-acetylglucosamine--N-acetylglucosamine transferase [Actinomycetota bacterium]|nr:UDP-N-acetylglucosamine--N-acetylglucosamine transferase [Actinomycetota bacterium]
MGAGHDGAARTLAEQFGAAGHTAEVKDFLRSGPLRIGSALRMGYEFELRHVPSAYDATYRLWYRVPWLCPIVAWLVTFLTRRRVMRWVDSFDPWVVVSTYPLSTLCLGHLRRTGRLRVPAVNFITDFGVHPLWVHRGVDVNLAIHELPAQVAARRTGRQTVFTGPAVAARFHPDRLPARSEARARFGIGPGQRAVLIVAGSWGVGNVAGTFSAVARDGRFLPVVVCGRDERLQRHVQAMAEVESAEALVLGWTDEMPALMVACDALVENAGGLTSLEAMSAGLPVVSFDPIAGHGVENTTAMDAVGVGRLARDPAGLVALLAEVTEPGPDRDAQIARARAMFRSPPAESVLDAIAMPVAPTSPARRRIGVAVRATVATMVMAAIAWSGLTTGVAMAAYAGAGVAHPAHNPQAVAYLGVRLTAAEVGDPTVAAAIRRMDLTVVVDEATVERAAPALRRLVADGVTVANGGAANPPGVIRDDNELPWDQAASDVRAGRQISALLDAPVTQAVPGRRLTAWDLVDCGHAHTSIVVPNHILHVRPSSEGPIHLAARDIYVIDGRGASPEELATYLHLLNTSLDQAQLTSEPLATLA